MEMPASCYPGKTQFAVKYRVPGKAQFALGKGECGMCQTEQKYCLLDTPISAP